jgi:alginate O-acetyltransferase complex protein AlgI
MQTAEKNSRAETALASAWIAWVPLALVFLVAFFVRDQLPPWAFMWALALAIYAALKWASWWRSAARTQAPTWRSLGYLVAWPGMDAESFLDAGRHVAAPAAREWVWAFSKTIFGAVLLWLVARRVPASEPIVRGWVGLIGMVLLAHFGTFPIVALIWQMCGVDAAPIMAAPILSTSLSEFWGRRWNLGFRQLGHDLIFQPLHNQIGAGASSFLVFVASGVIHDFVISYPARGGYGLPTMYFLLQGAGVKIERSQLGKRLRLRRGLRGWLFTALFTAGPTFWLCHPPFLRNVVLPFMQVVHAL